MKRSLDFVSNQQETIADKIYVDQPKTCKTTTRIVRVAKQTNYNQTRKKLQLIKGQRKVKERRKGECE